VANATELRAEIARLQDEVDRLRLQQAGVHPGGSLVDAMQRADRAGDTADSAATMYVSSLAIRSELAQLLALLKASVEDFELRLQRLDRGLNEASIALAADDGEHAAAPSDVVELSDATARLAKLVAGVDAPRHHP